MLNAKESAIIILVTLVFALTISLFESTEIFLYILLASLVVILINTFAKKITAFVLDSEIEIKLWEMKQYGFKKHWHFKKPVPIGVLLPLIVTFLSVGNLIWLSSLVFDVKAKIYRTARRWGLYTFSEMTEWHIGLIAGWGIIATLVFSILGYLAGFTDFTKISIYYAFFNMLPIANLDGNKIYFGNVILWSFLAIVTLIAMFYALFVI